MKKRRWILPGILLWVLSVLTLAGCGKADEVEQTTVFVEKDAGLEQVIAEPMEGEDYTAQELKAYITEQLETYKQETGTDHIKLELCEVTEDKVRIRLSYKSWTDYKGFNQVECYVGTLDEARAAGYDFEQSFLDSSGNPASNDSILSHGQDWKVLILEEPVRVQITGTILYTTDNVSVTGADTAVIAGREPEGTAEQFVATTDTTAYIIFK